MPSLSLPVTLTANTNENVNDLNSDLNAIVTAINGNLDEVNVPNLSAAFTTYKLMWAGIAVISAGSNSYVVGSAAPTNLAVGAVGSAAHAFWFDPALFAANSRTTKLALEVVVISNAVAPGFSSVASALAPVATWGGTSGNTPSIATTGAQTINVGPTVPGASAATRAISADVSAPAAGPFCVFTAPGGTQNSGNVIVSLAKLYMREV